MRVVLRLVAVWAGLSTLGALSALVLVARTGNLSGLGARQIPALALLILWVLTGVTATVQLWRLRDLGRRAALFVCVAPLLSTVVQLGSLELLLKAEPLQIAKLLFSVLVFLLLTSRRARQACIA